jgi:hypothetical protein
MTQGKQQIGRLAFGVEGDWWVAYYARPDSMEGAIDLGRIQMALVQDRGRKKLFMDLMKSALGEFLRDATGGDPTWSEARPAPEHEKAGRA